MRQWYESESGWKRLQIEQQLVRDEYPAFRWDVNSDGYMACEGNIEPNNSIKGYYFVRCIYPYNYGHGERIKVYLPHEAFRTGTSHLYSDGEISLEHNDFTYVSDILDVLSSLLQWLVLYSEFCETGKRW
jgi:hypothetical protein